MPRGVEEIKGILLDSRLNTDQKKAVSSNVRKLLVIAGAGSGKTEVMARRVVWWAAIEQIPKEQIVAFTFTDAAAEELKFRIRSWFEKISLPGENVSLGGMYIGTIHGFCIASLREFAADEYYNFDVLDDAGRVALLEQGFYSVLALKPFCEVAKTEGKARNKLDGIELFLRGYDLLNEYNILDVGTAAGLPDDVRVEKEWCAEAQLNVDVGTSETAKAFALSAARYYAYLKARRFLDFSTSQSELMKALKQTDFRDKFRAKWKRLVVDEVQDINQVQLDLINTIVGNDGHLTAVGDHRQAIYSFRGGRVDLMGEIYSALHAEDANNVIELKNNYRSTPRIINLANEWSDMIIDNGGMTNPHMVHGNTGRVDLSNLHTATMIFSSRDDEAEWIAESIKSLVQTSPAHVGAKHDDGTESRGLTYSDISILLRSTTDIRTYQDALRQQGIPSIVRGGNDLFSQPEVLYFLAAVSVAAGVEQFYGLRDNTLPMRIAKVLGVETSVPLEVIQPAGKILRERGINVTEAATSRMLSLASAIQCKLSEQALPKPPLGGYKTKEAVIWLNRGGAPRRVFPQEIYQWLLSEAELFSWGDPSSEGLMESCLFHIGQLSNLIKSIETSGWTSPLGFKLQVYSLGHWGSMRAKIPEAPLLVSPSAVSITTVHAAKGLEYPAVFIADCVNKRFPSSNAGREPLLPFDKGKVSQIDREMLCDNVNHDDERRLMYVAITRAERYLYLSGSNKPRAKISPFISNFLKPKLVNLGGIVSENGLDISTSIELLPAAVDSQTRLVTSFSDLHYFLDCPHDFYLRKVLGFTPTIGQEFGYGRGLHNLLRVIHTSPQHWAELAKTPAKLEAEVKKLVLSGLFYLRYTTADPLENLRNAAVSGVVEYVKQYAPELSQLHYEPEKPFETLIPEESVLISGSIDVVRLDNPPRVTIIDFKSGDGEGDMSSGLSQEMMAMQIGIYGLASKHELEYDPQHGLVRYIGQSDPTKKELAIHLDESRLADVRTQIMATAARIKGRDFHHGPRAGGYTRCVTCDFQKICSRKEAAQSRKS